MIAKIGSSKGGAELLVIPDKVFETPIAYERFKRQLDVVYIERNHKKELNHKRDDVLKKHKHIVEGMKE